MQTQGELFRPIKVSADTFGFLCRWRLREDEMLGWEEFFLSCLACLVVTLGGCLSALNAVYPLVLVAGAYCPTLCICAHAVQLFGAPHAFAFGCGFGSKRARARAGVC